MRRSSLRDWNDVFVMYRYYDSHGRLLYVGSTKNIARRDAEHRAGGTGAFWYPTVARTRIQVFPTIEAARDAELLAIREEEPHYNLFGTDRRPGSRDHWTVEDRRLYKRWLARPGNYVGWWLMPKRGAA